MTSVPNGAAPSRTDKYYVYRPMLDLIGFTEGTDRGDGYNETLAYGAFTGGDVDLVAMTLNQIDALQTKMLQHRKNSFKSSACGRYQIVRTTARSIREDLPDRYPRDRKFDAECQDEMACYLLGVRGIDKYLAGRLSEDGLIENLAREWASLPTVAGKGYYGGQHAAVSTAQVRTVLAEVRSRHIEGQPETVAIPVPVERPVVPVTVEQEVKQKSGWLSGLFGGSFSLAGIGTWLSGGIDRDTLLIVLGAAAVGGVVFLLGGEWIARRVKSIRKEIEA